MPSYSTRIFALCGLLLGLAGGGAHAATPTPTPPPPAAANTPIPAPPTIAARAHLLLDYHSGRVLAENNADQRLEPASLTKIMTAYVIFRELKEGNVKLTDEVTISDKAWRTGGSRMFVEVGKKVPLEMLLKGMIVQSGNDSSIALAEHIAGSEETFAGLMNNHAKRLGMAATHFMNSTGLPDPEHYTTARDMAIVAAATIREFPQWYEWYSMKELVYNDIKQHNRNRLLWQDDSVDGVKTGHTETAGYCLVASAVREGMRLIAVVLGTAGEQVRAKESMSLLNYGFRFYETHRLYGGGESLSQVRLWKGAKEQLGLGVERDLYVTIPRNQYKKLDAQMQIQPQITAPVEKGQALGKVNISLDGKPLQEVPLVALESVESGGALHNMADSVLLWFE